MNVLHLCSEESWRGGEQQIAYLIEELRLLGVSSTVAVKSDSAFEKYCGEKAIPFFTLGFKNDFDFLSAIKLNVECKKKKFDIIHLHSSRAHGIAFLSSMIGNKVPMVLSRRVDFELKKNWFSKAKYNADAIRKIICVSDKVKEIVSRTIAHPEKCMIVYDGIDLNRFAGKGVKGKIREEFGISDDEVIIGNVAALAPHKDYFTFLETAKILSSKIKAKFLIAGNGPMKSKIENRIRELDLGSHVIMLGFRSDLESIYADLDVLLFTSQEEGLGSSILDAFACRVPVVSTNAGGIPEIVINEVTGLSAPVKDSTLLALNVQRLISNVSLHDKIVNEAAKRVVNFSKENMALRTLDVYNEVLSH